MEADVAAYGFEQLNDIRDSIIEAEGDKDLQKDLLDFLKIAYVDMTDEGDTNATIAKFVSSLFINSMKIVYKYFQETANMSISSCAEIISKMAMYAKDLSSFISNKEVKNVFYVSSFITKSFIDEIIKSSKPNNIIKLDHPIFATDYNIEEGNLEDIIKWI